MDILEHPPEAVAFRLYSLPDASGAAGAAAWTCLAAVLAAAAAAGLWRLRSSAAALNPSESEPSNAKEVSPEAERSPPGSAASTAAPRAAPKERYTAYYRDSGRVGCCDVDEEEAEHNDDEEEAEEQDEGGPYGPYQTSETMAGPFEWEVVRSLPLSPTAAAGAAADMGRYRGPTALSGSVVRLWDEVVEAGASAAASPRRRSRVVGTVSAF